MPLLRKKIVLKEMRARGQALGNGTPQGVKKKKRKSSGKEKKMSQNQNRNN